MSPRPQQPATGTFQKTLLIDAAAQRIEIVEALGSSSVPPPELYVPPDAGIDVIDIWRANWFEGVGFSRAIVRNWTYHGPVLEKLSKKYPHAPAGEVLEISAHYLGEEMARFLGRRLLRREVATGPERNQFKCLYYAGRNPDATLLRWLRKPGMAPGIADGPDLLAALESGRCPRDLIGEREQEELGNDPALMAG